MGGTRRRLIDPLLAALGRYVLAAEKVHADDTPVTVLDPGAGKTKTGRLWVYVRDDRPAGNPAPAAAWYRYSPDRKGEHPQAHLKKFRGILQADAYGGWAGCTTADVVEAACWAHARRPWWELYRAPGDRRTRWPRRRCDGSRTCTRSRPRSEANRRTSGVNSAAPGPGRC